jgi:hypothetical protein
MKKSHITFPSHIFSTVNVQNRPTFHTNTMRKHIRHFYTDSYTEYINRSEARATVASREWMGAGELSIEERILLTRTYRG